MFIQQKQKPETDLTYVPHVIRFMDKDALSSLNECLERVRHIRVQGIKRFLLPLSLYSLSA